MKEEIQTFIYVIEKRWNKNNKMTKRKDFDF